MENKHNSIKDNLVGSSLEIRSEREEELSSGRGTGAGATAPPRAAASTSSFCLLASNSKTDNTF